MKPEKSASGSEKAAFEFLRTFRLVVVWVLVAWLLFVVHQKFVAPLYASPYRPPTPPFAAVSTDSSVINHSQGHTPQPVWVRMLYRIGQVTIYNSQH